MSDSKHTNVWSVIYIIDVEYYLNLCEPRCLLVCTLYFMYLNQNKVQHKSHKQILKLYAEVMKSMCLVAAIIQDGFKIVQSAVYSSLYSCRFCMRRLWGDEGESAFIWSSYCRCHYIMNLLCFVIDCLSSRPLCRKNYNTDLRYVNQWNVHCVFLLWSLYGNFGYWLLHGRGANVIYYSLG